METFDTERLHMRRFTEGDFDDMYKYMSDPEVMKYEPPMDKDQSREWFHTRIFSNDFWAVCLADSGKLIGDLYMGDCGQGNWELGYMLNRRYQRRGYATEAAAALICRTFDVEKECHRICAFCNPENIASWQLLDRLGFHREGYIRQNTFFREDKNGDPIWQDTLIYGILKDEWNQRNNKTRN